MWRDVRLMSGDFLGASLPHALRQLLAVPVLAAPACLERTPSSRLPGPTSVALACLAFTWVLEI